MPFNNHGIVEVQAGTLVLSGGGSNSNTGLFLTSAGAIARFTKRRVRAKKRPPETGGLRGGWMREV